MARPRAWWAARPLRWRITAVVGLVALAVLLALSRLGVGLLYDTLLGAADVELRGRAHEVAARLAAGSSPAAVAEPSVRVLDSAGAPVDGAVALPLRRWQLRELAAGEAVSQVRGGELRRWVAVPAVVPDGSTRLVVASADLVGGTTLLARAAVAFVLAALAAAAVVAFAAWAATRAALRPVDRMAAAAAALPPGERLPVPAARDELRALAEELNRLLARRDDAAARLERFTGDAAHELRSPVAAIRAQAEVALAHPEPELVDDTLRVVAVEAQRLTVLLADLLALARADAGQRPPPRPVDVVEVAGASMAGAVGGDGPAVRLVAPAPAFVEASTAEVELVVANLLDNARRYARSVVTVSVLPAGSEVRLVVEDDGPGIPEADRERVFDRFVRLEPAAGGGGAGLGLALVEALVRGRGGTVRAGAAAGGGARVEARWPASRGEPAAESG